MQENKAQERVIQTIEGQMIVVACPGSGKTTTLVRRIHHMVSECDIPSEHILMITFTAAAAKEMKERYQKLYGRDEVTFSTIHALCMAILRKFRGLTNDDLLVDSRDFFFSQLRNVKKINDKAEFIKMCQTDISVIKNNSLDPETYTPKCCDDAGLFRNLFYAYEAYKKQTGQIDFDDMLIHAYQVMKDDPSVLEWLQEKYRYIQVDEYQDTNFLQRDIIYLLAGPNGNLTVVGDDDQSIYGFRGARPEIMLSFKRDYPDAEEIYMSTNYRSTKKIIQCSDMLIRRNSSRFAKDFIPFSSEDGTVDVVEADTREQQLMKIAMMIKKHMNEGQSDISVLYRTNGQAESIANKLLTLKVPFYSTEKIQSRYKGWMFSDIQAFYRLANGKAKRTDLYQVLNHPQRFLMHPGYARSGLDINKMKRVAYKVCDKDWQCKAAIKQIQSFFSLLSMLKDKKPSIFLTYLYSSYSKYLEEYANFRNMDKSELEDMYKSFVRDASEHDDWKDWGLYITRYNMALEKNQNNREGVALSTMHCSKGLEWDEVYIIDCVDGTCPFAKAEGTAALEEERRLFYVAMTRAKKMLHLCRYRIKGRKETKPSPYLRECR